MSLKVWLPLNGDFHNQGLDNNLNFTENGTISDSDGKIGKSKQFSSSGAIAPYNFTLGSQASICCWIYYTSLPSSSSNDWLIHLGSTSGYTNAVLGLSTYHNSYLTVMVGGKSDSTYEHEFSINTWYHIAFTWDNSFGKLYINGQLKKTYSNLNNGTVITSDKISLGSNVVNSSTKLKGKLNDVRIYDHCLSSKEVEEISKGLVLHFKLDLPQFNLLKLGNIEQSNNSQNKNILYYYYDFNNNLPIGTYTFSFDAKSSNGTDSCYTSYANGANTIQRIADLINIPATYTHYSFTFTNASTNSNNIFFTNYKGYGGSTNSSNTGYLYVKNVKLENDSVETPFELAASEGRINSTVFNCSGYGNNGIINGNLIATANSPRYNTATTFPTENDYFYFPHFTDNTAMNNEFTFSGWIYRDYTDATIRYFYYGLCALYLHTDFKPRVQWQQASADLSYNSNNAWGPTSNSLIIPFQTWTHFAFTYLNGALKFYINGKLIASTDRSNTGQFIRGTKGSPNASLGYDWIGKLSDVRTYATALSAAAIKELYDTSVTVDSSGNTYARELVELS